MTLDTEAPPLPLAHNIPEYSVSDLSRALKSTVEETYARVRVRGEISGFKRHSSGHLYLALKDTEAVLDAVCWRGQASRLGLSPEDGLEVICTGRLTTYPGRSKYQMVIESMELAGEGALLKLLEDRKRRLAAEGLFHTDRKKPIPFLPTVIGVITSPTGAVIRDILHRLAERFPRPVLLWPVAVQGEGAAEQIAAAIRGFNNLPIDGPIPRPDVLIVARGGGSLEDLWAFNEEIVVRAAAESLIPLISAVGHETDTTLIDYASDLRAPTPTGAAEKAVPVRLELLAAVSERSARLSAAAGHLLEERRTRMAALMRALPRPQRLLEERSQRLDERSERLLASLPALLRQRTLEVQHLSARLRGPRQIITEQRHRLERLGASLLHGVSTSLRQASAQHDRIAVRLRLAPIKEAAERAARETGQMTTRLDNAGQKIIPVRTEALNTLGKLLESYSYKGVLARGFTVVRAADGTPVTTAAHARPGASLNVEFSDGSVQVLVQGSGSSHKTPSQKSSPPPPLQGSLL